MPAQPASGTVVPNKRRVKAEPCADCGRTDWIAAVVTDDGRRACLPCFTGRTRMLADMRARGVPI